MKRKKDNGMVQTALRLPQSLRDRLSSAGGERGLGDEIRRRLEASFVAEKAPANPKTRELLDAIFSFAEGTTEDYGSWSEDPFAFELLKACVSMLLTHYQPKGEPIPKPTTMGLLTYGPDPSIDDVSRFIVGSWIRNRAKVADKEKPR